MVILHLAVTNELQVVFDFPGFKALSLGISPRKSAWIFHLSIASIIPNKIRQEAQVAPSTMPGPQKELIKPANTLWVPLENHHFFHRDPHLWIEHQSGFDWLRFLANRLLESRHPCDEIGQRHRSITMRFLYNGRITSIWRRQTTKAAGRSSIALVAIVTASKWLTPSSGT